MSFINKDICELCYCLKDLSFFHPIYSLQMWQDQCFLFQHCDIAQVVIIHNSISTNLVIFKDESTKILSTLLHCRKLWQIFMIIFFNSKSRNLLIIFFLWNTFHKMMRTFHTKNSPGKIYQTTYMFHFIIIPSKCTNFQILNMSLSDCYVDSWIHLG